MNNTNERKLEICKELNNLRSKISALYSLYNSLLLDAETNRSELSRYYEQMLDFKNDLNSISNLICAATKAERVNTYNKSRPRIKRLDSEINQTILAFKETCQNYRQALKDCGSLKTEYKHEVKDLCKEFVSIVDVEKDALIIKGYKQQVKMIKIIFEKIEQLINDYNIKKNKVEEDNNRFVALYDSVNSMLDRLESIA